MKRILIVEDDTEVGTDANAASCDKTEATDHSLPPDHAEPSLHSTGSADPCQGKPHVEK